MVDVDLKKKTPEDEDADSGGFDGDVLVIEDLPGEPLQLIEKEIGGIVKKRLDGTAPALMDDEVEVEVVKTTGRSIDDVRQIIASRAAGALAELMEGSSGVLTVGEALIAAFFESGEGFGSFVDMERFFDERAMSHKSAKECLLEVLPGIGDDVGLDYEKWFKCCGIDPWFFYSSTPHDPGAGENGNPLEVLIAGIEGKLRREDRVYREMPVRFMGTKDKAVLAAECPRCIPPESDLSLLGIKNMNSDEDYAVESVRIGAMFALATHAAVKSGHRQAYHLASVAASLAHRSGKKASIPPANIMRSTPSLVFTDIIGDKVKARNFIDARLSLLLPDVDAVDTLIDRSGESIKLNYVVQEDFITADLIAFAIAAGLYDEYAPVFDTLFRYRRLQFVKNFHLSRDVSGRLSLVDVLRLYSREKHENLFPKVVSLGCGDGFMESLIADLVDSVSGVDKGGAFRSAGEVSLKGGRVTLHYVEPGDRDISNKKDSREFRKEVLDRCGWGNILIIADALHETDDPANYLIDAYRHSLAPGGILYLTDPVHSELVDGQTKFSLNPFDSTRHPGSMLSMEQYHDLILYLGLKGAEVLSIGVVPGAYAGYADALWRLSVVIRKPLKGIPRPYAVSGESTKTDREQITSVDELFRVFPLNFVMAENDRRKIGEKIDKITLEAGGVTRGGIRTFVTKCLVGSAFMDLLEDKKIEPYPALEVLLKRVGRQDDTEVIDRNKKAVEVIVLVTALKGMGIDITADVQNTPGWERHRF